MRLFTQVGKQLGWVLAVTLTSCDNAPSLTNDTGTELIGSRGVLCDSNDPLTVSPNGHWLVIEAEESDRSTKKWRLIDLESNSAQTLRPSVEVENRINGGHGPNLYTLCWDSDSRSAYLSGPSLPAFGSEDALPNTPSDTAKYVVTTASTRRRSGNYFVINTTQPYILGTSETISCQRPPPMSWKFGKPQTNIPSVTRDLKIQQADEDRVILSAQNSHFIVEHTAQSFFSDRIGLSTYSWSPSGRYLAYVLVESFGMGGPPAQSYLLDTRAVNSAPRKLALHITTLSWRDDTTLLACQENPNGEHDRVLHWSFTDQ